MDYGLPDAAREAIFDAYEASVGQRGLWIRPDGSKAYGATNADEYFAELSMVRACLPMRVPASAQPTYMRRTHRHIHTHLHAHTPALAITMHDRKHAR